MASRHDDLNWMTCGGCGHRFLVDKGAYADACEECELRYPASLLKSTNDYFDYALGLRTGEVVHFSQAKIMGEWVHLTMGDYVHGDSADYSQLPFPFARGVDVRVADIVWCCDAPYGS